MRQDGRTGVLRAGREGQGVVESAAWWEQPGLPGAPTPLTDDGLDHVAPLTAADLDRLWSLDFHHPRAVLPLALGLVDDIATASQVAAAELPLGMGGGFATRLVGPHVYLGACPEPAVSDAAQAAAAAEVADYPARFAEEWRGHAGELAAGYARLDAVDLRAADTAGLVTFLADARRLHRWAWRAHFRVMYRLFALQRSYLEVTREVGLAEVDAVALLQGEDNAILAADRALLALAVTAQRAGLGRAILAAPPGRVLPALYGRSGADRWRRQLARVLAVHGQRGDALSDLSVPSWAEDPEIPLALVRAVLESEPASAPPATSARERADAVLAGLSPAAQARLAPALDVVRRANPVWWNEEHNALIDLRVHLPVRRVALALGDRWGADRPDDVLYLYAGEVDALLAGAAAWADLSPALGARREYVAGWRARRAELPMTLGSGDSADAVLEEILGTSWVRSAAARHPGDAELRSPDGGVAGGRVLTGLGVSAGVVRGPARVLRTADRLAELRQGEVLVCEATSPSWTSAFERLAGCVCDAGGMLTHAAIISREFGLPCVCAVGTATRDIRTGDLVEVDGSAGTVRVVGAVG